MDPKMKKFIPLILVMIIAFIAFVVYVVVNRLGMPTVTFQAAGFWLGLWQGAILLLSFITSWFDKSITIYQVGNTGFWYNFGYILGLTVALGGSHASRNSKKDCCCKE